MPQGLLRRTLGLLQRQEEFSAIHDSFIHLHFAARRSGVNARELG